MAIAANVARTFYITDNPAINNRELFLVWSMVVKEVGIISRWPQHMRTIFWRKELAFSECIHLAAFAVVNRLDINLLELWLLIHKTAKLATKEILHWHKEFSTSGDKYNTAEYHVKGDYTVRVNGKIVNPFGAMMDPELIEKISY